MSDSLIQAFIALFVVIDPVGQAPIFAGLTRGAKKTYQRSMAIRGVLLASIILFIFAFAGSALMDSLGVGLPAFKIAGGVLLFLIAVDMLFARDSGLRSTTEGELKEADHRRDISVFPLAIPLIAGPGAMTTVVLLLRESAGDMPKTIGILAILAFVLLLTLIFLLLAVQITTLLGVTGSNVISRVLGIILTSLAVQWTLDGIKEAFLQ